MMNAAVGHEGEVLDAADPEELALLLEELATFSTGTFLGKRVEMGHKT